MQATVLTHEIFDVAVVGGGPVGMAAALSFSRSGRRTALIAPPPPPPGTGAEARTAALFTPSITLLERLGVWPGCRDASAPLTGIRVIDETRTLLKAPEVLFEADEIGLAHFGYNVPNAPLAAALRSCLELEHNLTWFRQSSVSALDPRSDRVTLSLSEGGQIEARLVAAADGRHSICRTAASILADLRPTGQAAITANIRHTRPHYGISTEFHRAAGPCTVVPLPNPPAGSRNGTNATGYASSLVWIERTPLAERLIAMPDEDFLAALSVQLKGLLGTLTELSPRARFDLAFLRTSSLARNRVLLLGETAHVVPPLGAQGLNLSLRDVAVAVDCVDEAARHGRDPGSDEVLAAYEAQRSGDITSRVNAIDALNSSLLSDLGPIHLIRGAGLHMVRAVAPLRRQLMHLGLGGERGLPSLMR